MELSETSEHKIIEKLRKKLQGYHDGPADKNWSCPGNPNGEVECGSLKEGKARFSYNKATELVETLLLTLKRCETTGYKDLDDGDTLELFELESRHVKFILYTLYCHHHRQNAVLAVNAWRKICASVHIKEEDLNDSNLTSFSPPAARRRDPFPLTSQAVNKPDLVHPTATPSTPRTPAMPSASGSSNHGRTSAQRPSAGVRRQPPYSRQRLVSDYPSDYPSESYTATPDSVKSTASSVANSLFSAQSPGTPLTPYSSFSDGSSRGKWPSDSKRQESTPTKSRRRSYIDPWEDDQDSSTKDEDENDEGNLDAPVRPLDYGRSGQARQKTSPSATVEVLKQEEDDSKEFLNLPAPQSPATPGSRCSPKPASRAEREALSKLEPTETRREIAYEEESKSNGTLVKDGVGEEPEHEVAPSISDMLQVHAKLSPYAGKGTSNQRLIKLLEDEFGYKDKLIGKVYVGVNEGIEYLFKVGFTTQQISERYSSSSCNDGVDRIIARSSTPFVGAHRVEQLIHADLSRHRVILRCGKGNCKKDHKEWFVHTREHVLNTVELWTRVVVVFENGRISDKAKSLLDMILHAGSIVRAFEDIMALPLRDNLVVFETEVSFQEVDVTHHKPRPLKSFKHLVGFVVMDHAGGSPSSSSVSGSESPSDTGPTDNPASGSDQLTPIDAVHASRHIRDAVGNAMLKAADVPLSKVMSQDSIGEKEADLSSTDKSPLTKSSRTRKSALQSWDLVANAIRKPNGLKALEEQMRRASLTHTSANDKEGNETRQEPKMGIIGLGSAGIKVGRSWFDGLTSRLGW
ncbi:hypothetical protein S40293_06988 [Stachybotrys chartarum IBT 40293]|nr:hypothetical protein S40293_06988 [Stachybotrys chartarum IBT 40293]